MRKSLAILLCVVMLFGMMPATATAEHTPVAPAVDSTTTEYSVPSGSTLTIETYEYGFDSNYGIGKDYLFVIKKDGKYYAMQEMPVSEEPFDTIAAVEVTDWVAADGKSVTIPADPGNVAFIRYEDVNPSFYEMDLVERINGNACLGYDMTRVWDEGYDNILSETMRFTAQSADASGSSMLWQTTADNHSGTFYQYSRRSINYESYYVDYAVDLREDGNGGYEFYWRTINDEALDYDGWQTQQEQGFGVEGYLFSGACRHQSKIDHTAYDAPTCMDKGCAEYWFCHGCERYFKDAALTQLHKAYLTPDGYHEPILAATGHDWGTNGCNNCGLATPVYTKITTMEQLSALGDHASFILVAQYGGKTYVLDGGDPEALAKRIDANGDMYEDIIEIDNNNNGSPDCLEIDEDSNGVWDYLEKDLVNNDGIVDWYDYQNYWYDMDFGGLFDDVYSANAYEGGIMGAIEVTPHADGTITLSNDHILCFELTQMLSDEDIEMNLGYELEYNPEMTEEEQEAYRQNLQSNLMMKLPNLWLQPYFCWTNRAYMEDRPMYGDQTMWRFYFYDDIKDKTIEVEEYDYELGDYVIKEVSVLPEDFETTAFSLSDGSVLIYSTYDLYGGLQNARENLHNSIRLRDVDGAIDFVGGSSVMDPETYEYIELNGGTQVSIYLYASDVAPTHTCDFSKWAADEGADTHSRTCQDPACGKTETKPHSWDKGAETKAPTCTEAGVMTYTCTDCGATKTETMAALDHDWSDWEDDGANAATDTHSHTCNRNCGAAAESEPHSWGNWTPDGDTNHMKTCSVCSGTRTDTHQWGKGVETKAPTEEEEGIMTYTCSVCNHSKTEPIAKLEHDLTFVPAVAATCEEAGNIAYYRCSHCKRNYSDETATEELSEEDIVIAALDHDWADWSDAGEAAAADVHKRSCKREGCEAVQTEAHQWGDWNSVGGAEHEKTCSICSGIRSAAHNWDEGTVVEPATTTQTGLSKHTCADCGAAKTKVLPKVVCDHIWGQWKADDDKTHTHRCTNDNGCTAYQTQEHAWDAGVVTAEPTETAEGVKTYTCSVCGHTKEEKLAMLEHTHRFGEWISDGTDTHTRRCENGETCTAVETAAHSCDSWTTNNDGTHSGKCSVCGEGMTEAHSFGSWAVGTTEEQFIRSCKCGATEEMTVQKPISEAISNTTNSETNGANAELATEEAVELFNSVLTEEEQTAVADGDVTVSVYLEVQDIPVGDVSSSDKAAAEAALESTDNEQAEIGMYLDINLFKEVTKTDAATSQTETEESKITETSGKVSITITIPEELINTDGGISRTYRIVRVHEDESGKLITDVIEGVFNKRDKTFTFETDKFSTYAVAYTDATITNPNNPQTGDNSNLLLWVSFAVVSGGMMLALYICEKMRKQTAK